MGWPFVRSVLLVTAAGLFLWGAFSGRIRISSNGVSVSWREPTEWKQTKRRQYRSPSKPHTRPDCDSYAPNCEPEERFDTNDRYDTYDNRPWTEYEPPTPYEPPAPDPYSDYSNYYNPNYDSPYANNAYDTYDPATANDTEAVVEPRLPARLPLYKD